jgi:hypothetical protein
MQDQLQWAKAQTLGLVALLSYLLDKVIGWDNLKNLSGKRHTALVPLNQRHQSSACGLSFHQQTASVRNEIADLKRFHQEWNAVLLKEGTDFRFREA